MAGRGVELDKLTAMRVKFWLAGVAEAGGCATSELVDLPALADISSLEFPLYTQGRRKPSHATLNLVEQALPGTRVRYDQGPGAANLWGILEGDRDACQSHLDAELLRTGYIPPKSPRFRDKVTHIWLQMLPARHHYRKSSQELIAEPDTNLFADTYKAALRYKAYDQIPFRDTINSRAKISRYPVSLVIAVIALWKLRTFYPESESEPICRYMLNGVLDMAVREELTTPVGAEVEDYLRGQLASESGAMLKP